MNVLLRRQWQNVALLALAGSLIIILWFTSPKDEAAGISPLLHLTPARIEHITVERPGQASLAFERREKAWWMVVPGVGLANPVLLEPIQRFAETRCPLCYAASKLDLKMARLDPPLLRLRLDSQSISFGAVGPVGPQRYLQIGDTVYLCPDTLYSLLTSAAESFLAPAIDTLLEKTEREK